MAYAEKINGTWTPKSPAQFQKERNASIPKPRLEEQGLYEVTTEPRPAPGDNQIVAENPITEVNGRPTKTWTVRDMTQAEIDAAQQAQIDRLEREVDQASGVSDVDKAIGFLLADLWRAANPGMSLQDARTQVRARLKTHLENIKGLSE